MIKRLTEFFKNRNSAKKNNTERKIPKLTMFVIADLHVCFREDMGKITRALENEQYDCVLCLGDIYAEDMRTIASRKKDVPCLYVIGNHDEWQQNGGIPGITDLDGKTVCVNGVKISGVSGAPRYKSGNWGMRSEEEMEKVLSGIGETDILVSHESPYRLLSPNRTHGGFMAITEFVEREKPVMHIFGHHHIDQEEMVGTTKEICVYGCSVITTDPYEKRKIL